VAVIAGAGCAAKPDTETEPARPVFIGERPARSYGPDTAAEPVPAPAESIAHKPVPSEAAQAPAAQGPPEWWFSGERRQEGSVSVCAAGFGADLPRAREAAIDAARERLKLFVSGDVPEAQGPTIERLSVMPLPGSSATRARYVGYAMVSAGLD